MTKAEKIVKLWDDLQNEEDQEYALSVWYGALPKKILSQLETPCWGKEVVEAYYGVALSS